MLSGGFSVHRACDSQSLSPNELVECEFLGGNVKIMIWSDLVALFVTKFDVSAALRALSLSNSDITSDS